MKKRYIVIFSVLITFLVIGIMYFIFAYENKNQKKLEEKEDIITNVDEKEKIEENIVSSDITIEKIKENTGYTLSSHEMIIGSDSILRKSLEKELISKYKLENYEKIQSKYAAKVEQQYLENLEYKTTKTKELKNGEVQKTIKVKTYYYALYVSDMTELAILLFEKSGYNLANVDVKEKETANFYKAKVKAMELMDDYLDAYKNGSEMKEFVVIYKNGIPKDRDDMITLVSNFKGMTYENMNFSKLGNIEKQKERINKYFLNGKRQNLIDSTDILKLLDN